ncbi:MAG TPA: AI-2E family transporter [Pyrinomonadaceae bacterium]|jgi:predicted PurR-regulated permease PerM|nr:AI-2E family transporter [Pyrinomonadaceae bacterium]
MAEETTETDEKPKLSNENVLGEQSQTIHRVALVSSSPSARSIVRVVLIVLLLLAVRDFLGIVISSLTYLFFMIVLAIFFAYLINPLVNLIQRPFENVARGKLMPRSLAIALSFLLVFSVIATAVYLLAPKISEQAKTFATNIPTYTTAVQSSINDINRRLDRMRVSDSFQTQLNDRINAILDSAGTFITTLFGLGAIYLIGFLPWLVLIPILAFFFLKDAQLFRVALLRVVPVGDWRSRVESILSDVNSTLVAYTRAQIISCVWIGFVCTIGFYLIGNDYALLLGILAGVFELVPLIGPLTIAILATVIAGFESGWQSLWTVIFLGLLRISQDYFVYPRIVREGIHLHPLAVILSVLAGEQVAGIAGVFIAIPIVALATVLYKHILQHTDSRGLFTGLLEPKENKEIASS